MPEKVLIYSRFPKAQMERFGQRFDLLNAAGQAPNNVFSADQLSDIRAMITAGGTPLGGAAMDLMPKLGAIVCYGTGYDGLDLAAAAKRKIAVGRRIGVYGMGEIGRKIAARIASFETEVGYFSRSRHDVPYRYFPTLDALAEWCSVLMIAVRAGADTNHAVDADILKKLGKDGYVVNISRGSVIDQKALVAALTEQCIAGAGLDVYEKEPHAPDALTALPNVVLSPHIGGHTLESHVAMQDCVIANLEAFFAGQPLPYAVPLG
jgi:hydroxypyruvate reductase